MSSVKHSITVVRMYTVILTEQSYVNCMGSLLSLITINTLVDGFCPTAFVLTVVGSFFLIHLVSKVI